MAFWPAAARMAASRGALDAWVAAYLRQPGWANPGLRAGLAAQPRHWLGPLRFALGRLSRCTGPEPGVEHPMPETEWSDHIHSLAKGLTDPDTVPPLIAEWRAPRLGLRDGNRRHAAMLLMGWTKAWTQVWTNSPEDHAAAAHALKETALGPA